jgi:hypothetical protein
MLMSSSGRRWPLRDLEGDILRGLEMGRLFWVKLCSWMSWRSGLDYIDTKLEGAGEVRAGEKRTERNGKERNLRTIQ